MLNESEQVILSRIKNEVTLVDIGDGGNPIFRLPSGCEPNYVRRFRLGSMEAVYDGHAISQR